jgi:hypothetical protein
MKSEKIKFLLCIVFFAVLAAVTFRCTWPADHIFSASDMNIGRLAFKKHFLPESLTGYFTANQVMGASGAQLILFNVLLALFPLEFFANTFYGAVLVISSVGMVWFLRLWNRSWLAAISGALVSFWFNSIMLAAGGHAYKMEVLAALVLTLCFIEKSIRADRIRIAVGYALLAGVCVGIMMLEQQDVALLAGLLAGPYAFFRLIQNHLKAAGRWMALLLPIAVVALLLSGNAVLGSYKANIKGAAAVQEDGNGTAKWNYITQWSMVPSEWPDLIASGWGGWGTGRTDGPYWGKIGRSPEWESTGQGFRNFKITSKYLGIIPFLLGAYGVAVATRFRREKDGSPVLFWSFAGLLCLLLAFGKYSPVYKLFYQLPLVGNIRDQSKFLDLFQICLGIVSAYGLDRLLERGRGQFGAKVLWGGSALCAGLMLLAGLGCFLWPTGRIAEFTAMGFGPYAKLLVRNMGQAWLHAGLLAALCAGLVFCLWKGIRFSKWVAPAFVAILAMDSLALTSRYFKADDIGALRRGNVLINYLKENQGNERTVFMDPNGIYNQWMASDGPYHRLNLFNIWQMPRMPVEYKEYLGKVGRNQIRLWQLSAVKYAAAPAEILPQLQQNPELGKQFNPVLSYQVPTAQGMRSDVLLQLNVSIPRFALFENWESIPIAQHCEKLASSSHHPMTTVLVDAGHGMKEHSGGRSFTALKAKVTKRKAVVAVDTAVPAILRFAQRFQPNWRVFVDGTPAKLLRIDYLSMGVQVPPGRHDVEFRCVSRVGRITFVSLVFIGSVGLAVALIAKRKKNRQAGL